MSTIERGNLRAILDNHGVPDPATVSKLPKGGNKDKATWRDCRTCGGWHAPNSIHLDYVGWADVVRTLIEIDPDWNWEPVEWNGGRPAMNVVNGVASMWGRLTVLGKTVIGVGTCDSSKAELDKELIGDFLRNAAAKLGVALSLWSKAEWDEHRAPVDTAPTNIAPTTGQIIDDPFEWAHEEMLNAASVQALDAVAALAKTRLSDEQRAELRPIYLDRKAELTRGDA